jgi:hypothetical protein
MAGAKRIRFESFTVAHEDEQALRLIQNMVKAGSPVVNRGGVMSLKRLRMVGLPGGYRFERDPNGSPAGGIGL